MLVPRVIVTGVIVTGVAPRFKSVVVDVSPEYRALHPGMGPAQTIEVEEPRATLTLDIAWTPEVGEWVLRQMHQGGWLTAEFEPPTV